MAESQMGALLVEVVDILGKKSAQVALVGRDDRIEQFAATASPQRSATPFCHGRRQDVCNDSISMSRTVAGTSKPYFASRSKITYLIPASNENASGNGCVIHRVLGWAVSLKCRIGPRW